VNPLIDVANPHPLSDTEQELLADLPDSLKSELADDLRSRLEEVRDSEDPASHKAEITFYGEIVAALRSGVPSKAAAILATKTMPLEHRLLD
jgi:hypothetical protein